MRRKIIWQLSALVIAIGLVLVSPLSARAGVNDFEFSSFVGDYYISRDDEGRSTMRVVETLTAEFPDFDQNKGLERAIPMSYDGHWVSFELLSLTRNGQTEPVYEQRYENDNVIVATGTDDYVRGTQVYEFTYSLRDVTKDFDDHQELYWDINGTDWLQSFDSVTARIHFDSSTQDLFNGQTACYQGAQGSSQTCSVTEEDGVITFSSTGRLLARQNITAVVGFKEGAFEPYTEGVPGIIKIVGIIATSAISLMALAWAIIDSQRRRRQPAGRGTIVPEYLPPKDVSVALSGCIIKEKTKSIPAQIVDLAVKHYIRILETKDTGGLFKKKPQYSIELLKVDGMLSDERNFASALFPSLEIGQVYQFKAQDQGTTLRIYQQLSQILTDAKSSGYKHKVAGNFKPIIPSIISLAIAAGLWVYLYSLIPIGSTFQVLVFGLAALCVATAGFSLAPQWPLTAKGVELRDYLRGLKLYIKMAEADRLKVLQSPSGAEKTPVNTNSGVEMVRLYERVLPYAVLFGQEKDWAKQLTFYYENSRTEPDWYIGMSAFNAAAFVNSINNFSTSAGNTFSMQSNSSSSGLGGGGFSGGGGGGGGGGGR